MGINDFIQEILFGPMVSLEEAKRALAKKGLDSSLLDETLVNQEKVSTETEYEHNPYTSPKQPLPDNPRTYFRGLKIQDLASGDTIISGRVIIEDPTAYKKDGIWRPEIISNTKFKKAA